MSKRFYQIAFELGVPPRQFIRELASAGLSVGNQMVVMPPELEERIREVERLLRPPPEPVVVEAPEPEVAVEATEVADASVPTEAAETEGQTEAPAEETAVVGDAADAVAAEPGAAETGPAETGPAETGPAETGPAETGPAETGPGETVETADAPAVAAEAPDVDTEAETQVAPEVPAAPEAPVKVAAESTAPSVGDVPAETQTGQAPADVVAEPAAAPADVTPQPGDAGGATDAKPPRRVPQGQAPTPGNLVPTIDPRAGRLVKEAPRGGIPGVTSPPKTRAGGLEIQNLNPTIPQADRAPGARRDSHRRSSMPDRFRGKRGKETFHMRRRAPKGRREPPRPRPTTFEVEPPISVKKFSELSGCKAAEVVKVLFTKHQLILNVNAIMDQETIEILGLEFDIDIKFKATATAEDELLSRVEQTDDPNDLRPRPPVVTILGHVDHGKTTLLDKIRESDVASHEAGGITQHISASQVNLPDGRRVTFIDTPGHEAFTEMRARGAQVTDVVVLIVAADDGVMPQTIESISHVRAANVPMVVAITKSDKANADTTRVRQQLTEHDVFVEGYGGDVSAFDVSGITGMGVPELLEHIALMAEVDEERFQANPSRMAEGTVIESENSPQRGVVATVLVQNGTLERGDAVLAGESWGTVRAMFDYLGAQAYDAQPGDPVEIIGLDQPPEAGSKFFVLEDTNKARDIGRTRRLKSRERELAAQSKPTTVESLLGAISEGKIQELNVVLKADVKGSLEPIKGLLGRIGTDEVRVKVIHSAVGAVNDSDVILAGASTAWVIGFNVNIDDRARERAKSTGVEIRTYRVIYDIEKDVRNALEGKLTPEVRESVQGHAEILQVFQSSRLGNIAGCRVRDGIIRRDSMIRVKRAGEVVYESKVASLRREKDEVREVKDGFECGIRLDGWDAYEKGDEIEAYTFEEIKRTLE